MELVEHEVEEFAAELVEAFQGLFEVFDVWRGDEVVIAKTLLFADRMI